MTGKNGRDIPKKPSFEAVEQYKERMGRKPESMDTDSMGNTGSVARDSPLRSSPGVNLDGSLTQREKESKQARKERLKISMSVLETRVKYLLSRVAQLAGFVLVFLAAYEMFAFSIENAGLSLEFLPKELIHSLYLGIGLHPVLLLAFGSIIIWLTTSTSR